MPAFAIDTFAAAKCLRNAGFDEGQTDALVGTFASNILEGLASRDDVNHVEESLHKDIGFVKEQLTDKIDAVEDSLRKEIVQVEQRLTATIGANNNRMFIRLVYRFLIKHAGAFSIKNLYIMLRFLTG